MRCVNQTDHAVLNEVAEVDGVRHPGREAPGEGFDERKPGGDPLLSGGVCGVLVHAPLLSNPCANPVRYVAYSPSAETAWL